jgi:hypothetical protein
MKKILILLVAALAPLYVQAGLVATNALNLQAVANTTINGPTNAVSGISLPNKTYLIQNTGIPGATNAIFTLNVQASFDGLNWTTIAVYTPTAVSGITTNATVESFQPTVNNVTAYMRVQAVTTNTVTLGVTSVSQN